MSNQLVCNSFDTQYKKIQSFKNQYLNMIRSVLKHKNNIEFEQIMTYNTIESRINDIMNDINNYTKELKLNKKQHIQIQQQIQQQHQIQSESENQDTKMIETLTTFLPYMILYYNHLETINLLTIPLD
jgi:molybdopterin-biosynthesis enzyme MoeA-like protein